MDKGTAVVTAGERAFDLRVGEVVFHKPQEFHALRADPNDPPNVFIVCFCCRSQAMNFFAGKHMTVPTPLRPYIGEIITAGQDTYYLNHDSPYAVGLRKREDAPFDGEQLIRLNLELFLLKLRRYGRLSSPKSPVDDHADRLTRRMMERLNDSVYSRISVDSLCQELGFSRAYLSAHFKKNTGRTITQYLTELKIKEAKYLIRKERYSVARISEFLCYDNPHYFCRVFKKQTQMTPKQYRNSVLFDPKEQP